MTRMRSESPSGRAPAAWTQFQAEFTAAFDVWYNSTLTTPTSALQEVLERSSPLVAIIFEGGGWVVLFSQLPVHGAGLTRGEAVEDALEAVRDYVGAWNVRLWTASNHVGHALLVHLLDAATDAQLRAWMLRATD